MALASVAFPEALFTDCSTVQKGVQQSSKWASSSKRRYARIWMILHVALDDGVSAGRVAWMPAHTGAGSVGRVDCSDGTTLTVAMRCANEMADLLAKRAAGSCSIGAPVREWLRSRHGQAKELAIYVGSLTYEAGAHLLASGQIARDSQGIDSHMARRPKAKIKANAKVKADPTPGGLFQRLAKLAEFRDRIMLMVRDAS